MHSFMVSVGDREIDANVRRCIAPLAFHPPSPFSLSLRPYTAQAFPVFVFLSSNIMLPDLPSELIDSILDLIQFQGSPRTRREYTLQQWFSITLTCKRLQSYGLRRLYLSPTFTNCVSFATFCQTLERHPSYAQMVESVKATMQSARDCGNSVEGEIQSELCYPEPPLLPNCIDLYIVLTAPGYWQSGGPKNGHSWAKLLRCIRSCPRLERLHISGIKNEIVILSSPLGTTLGRLGMPAPASLTTLKLTSFTAQSPYCQQLWGICSPWVRELVIILRLTSFKSMNLVGIQVLDSSLKSLNFEDERGTNSYSLLLHPSVHEFIPRLLPNIQRLGYPLPPDASWNHTYARLESLRLLLSDSAYEVPLSLQGLYSALQAGRFPVLRSLTLVIRPDDKTLESLGMDRWCAKAGIALRVEPLMGRNGLLDEIRRVDDD